jgi:hypothetical protein
MSLRRIAPALAFVFALAARDARAFFDLPWITPATPTAGDVVSASFRMGDCDARVEKPGFPQITRTGNEIRLVVYGVHEDTAELCVYPAATGTESIGALEAGSYTVTVDFVYDDYPFGLAIIALGVVPFTVTAAVSAVSVPVATPFWKLVLVALIASVASRMLPMSRRNKCLDSRRSL